MQSEAIATTQPKGTDTSTHQRGALDPDLFCSRLQRLLLGAASELGQRGNLAQVVASIERGGVGGAGEDPNLGMLRRLGATDSRGIDGRVGQLRQLELRWRALEPKRQATALAHYLGTPRADPSIREHFGNGSDPESQQGSLAGVVLHRWQLKQAKARARDAAANAAKAAVAIDGIRAELTPLEIEIALSEYRRFELAETVKPLQLEMARLCAQQAELAATGNDADDELGLVKLCRGGLGRGAKAELLRGAEADVRALHRDWYATAKRAAKAWAEEGAPA